MQRYYRWQSTKVNAGQGWFISSQHESISIYTTSEWNWQRISQHLWLTWESVLHTNSHNARYRRNISINRYGGQSSWKKRNINIYTWFLARFGCRCHWLQLLRSIYTVHAEQVKREESQREKGVTGSQECKYTSYPSFCGQSKYLPGIGALMKSIDSPYLLQISACGNDDGDDDDNEHEVRRITCNPLDPLQVIAVIPLPPASRVCVLTRVYATVYLRTGAHRSLRAIKHESRVTFIPLWDCFFFFYWPSRRVGSFVAVYPFLPVHSTLFFDFTSCPKSSSA